MRALWLRLVAGLQALMAREPALVVKVVTWAVTWAVTYASQQWFQWADDRQAMITGLVVAWVLGQIADWLATRKSVYAPASVVATFNRVGRVVAGPASSLPDGEWVDVDPAPYAPRHASDEPIRGTIITAAEGEARVKATFPDEFHTTGGDE